MKKISLSVFAVITMSFFISCSNNSKEETTTVETIDTAVTVKEEKVETKKITPVQTTTIKKPTTNVQVSPNGVKANNPKTNISINKNGVSTTTKKGTDVKVTSKEGVKISF